MILLFYLVIWKIIDVLISMKKQNNHLYDDLKAVFEYIEPNRFENSYDWGRTINPIAEVWSHTLNLGFRWYKQQLAK